MYGNIKVQKSVKTKYRDDYDNNDSTKQKKKHHDKSYYRLLRQEREEYGYYDRDPETN